ncbi:hypothetical protein BDV59DRAFT_171881 [Aspergillus ambiguus]|uniref:uncharacterized protein n=1 Tax=Aspergillus ambiguus TaxID=176160 RepID=UPI003CCC90A9
MPCDQTLNCGHQCPLRCHRFSHNLVKCDRNCNGQMPCGHVCPRPCSEHHACRCTCSPGGEEAIESVEIERLLLY